MIGPGFVARSRYPRVEHPGKGMFNTGEIIGRRASTGWGRISVSVCVCMWRVYLLGCWTEECHRQIGFPHVLSDGAWPRLLPRRQAATGAVQERLVAAPGQQGRAARGDPIPCASDGWVEVGAGEEKECKSIRRQK